MIHLMCVGGSGLRVLRSLIMLMASGYKIGNQEIKPYIVDPHIGSTEIKNAAYLIDAYSAISECNSEHFFGMKLHKLSEQGGNNIMGDQNQNRTFSDYLGFANLKSKSSEKYLIDMLYNDINLNAKLEVGFKGAPNVGSVIFNEFVNDDKNGLKQKIGQPKEEDVFVIVGSLFGGTGASGMTVIANELKKILGGDTKICAIAMLPYYTLGKAENNDKNNVIQSECFDLKAFKALEMCVRQQPHIDSFYIVGDDNINDSYDYDETNQGNPAHVVELVAATAIKDFCDKVVDTKKKLTQWNMFHVPADLKNTKDLKKDGLGEGMDKVLANIADFYAFCKFYTLMQKDKYWRYPFYNRFKDCIKRKDDLRRFIYNSDNSDSFIAWLGELYYNKGHRMTAVCAKDIDEKGNFNPEISHNLFESKDGMSNKIDMSEYFVRINKAAKSTNKDHDDLQAMLDAAYDGIHEKNK